MKQPVLALTKYLLEKKTKMTRFSMFILFVIIPLTQLYSQQLKGIVTDAETKLALPYSTVHIIDLEIATLTDSNGRFLLSNSLPPFVKVKISSIGYESAVFLIATNQEEHTFILSEKHFEIDEVTISTTKGTMQKNSVVRVESRKISDLNAIGNSSLGEAISTIPGVYQSTTGVGVSKPVIRGMQGVRVVTLLNGLRIENQQWGGDHGMGITELGIGSVEVIKGPSSLLYGVDALGGVLYFIDESYAKQNTYEIGLKTQNESNSLGTSNQLWYKQAKRNYRFNVAGSYTNYADYKLPNGLHASNSRFYENGAKAAFGVNKNKWAMHIRYNFSNNNVGIPGHTHDSIVNILEFQVSDQKRKERIPYQHTTNHFLSVENKWFFKKSEITLLLGQTANKLIEHAEKVTIPSLDLSLFNSLYSFKLATTINQKWNLISGAQGMFQSTINGAKASGKILPNSTTIDNGLFSILNYQNNNWNVQGGIRYDFRILESKEEINDQAILKRTIQNFNFSLGAVKSSKKNTFRVNTSSGFRGPHLSELLANGVHHGTLRYEIGNRNLISENATQLDITYERHGNHFELIVNPFFNYIENYIYIQPIDSMVEQYPVFVYNQLPVVYMYGGDFGIHYHPHFAHWLHLESNVSFLQASSKNGDSLSLMPQNRLNTFMKISFKSKTKFRLEQLTLQHTYLAQQTRVSEFETPSKSYQLFNASLQLKYLSKTPISINIGVKNILNTQYIDHLSRLKNIDLSHPGRNIYISFKYNFSNSLK